MVARCLNKWKTHSLHFFANVSLKFSNINYRRVASAHIAILLSFYATDLGVSVVNKDILIIPDP